MDSVRALLSHETEGHYKDTLPVAMTKWSHAFSQFFVDSIHPVVSQLGRWALQVYGLDQITGNQSESFNCVLKRLQEWRYVSSVCHSSMSWRSVVESAVLENFYLRPGTFTRRLKQSKLELINFLKRQQ